MNMGITKVYKLLFIMLTAVKRKISIKVLLISPEIRPDSLTLMREVLINLNLLAAIGTNSERGLRVYLVSY